MSATECLVGDAVAAELNDAGREWAASLPNPAFRTWAPWYAAEAGDLDTLKVSVLPTAIPRTGTAQDRAGLRLFDYEVWIDFQVRVAAAGGVPDIPAVDALCLVCEQMQNWFNIPAAHALTGLTSWKVIKAERELIVDENLLYSEGVFRSEIKLTVQGFR